MNDLNIDLDELMDFINGDFAESEIHVNALRDLPDQDESIENEDRVITELEGIDPEILALFNPYHDNKGRFAPAPGGSGGIGVAGGFEAAIAQGKIKQELLDASEAAANKVFEATGSKEVDINVYQKRSDYTQVVCGKWDMSCRSAVAQSWAMYVFKDQQIHVSPTAHNAAKRDPQLFEFVIEHESYHARDRSDGTKLSGPFKTETVYGSWVKNHYEEGAASLLARRIADPKDTNRKMDLFYTEQQYAVAHMARHASGGDRNKAWGIVDGLHKDINNTQAFYDAYSTYRNNYNKGNYPKIEREEDLAGEFYVSAHYASGSDLSWLMGGGE